MRSAQFHTSATRIHDAVESLEAAWAATEEEWRDSSSRNFNEEHIEPIGPKVRAALIALNRLSEVASRVQRECGD